MADEKNEDSIMKNEYIQDLLKKKSPKKKESAQTTAEQLKILDEDVRNNRKRTNRLEHDENGNVTAVGETPKRQRQSFLLRNSENKMEIDQNRRKRKKKENSIKGKIKGKTLIFRF